MTTKRYLHRSYSAAIQPCRLKLFTFRSFNRTPFISIFYPIYLRVIQSLAFIQLRFFVVCATDPGIRLHMWLELRSGHRKPVAFLSKEDLDSRFIEIRLRGAIDRVYRFLCCVSLGYAAKNGTNTSIETNCKSIGSQDRVSATTAPSSPHSCWVGVCQRTGICTYPSENFKGTQLFVPFSMERPSAT